MLGEALTERVVTTQPLPLDPSKTRLLGWRITHETPDHIAVSVDVFNDGTEAESILVCGDALDDAGNILTGCRPAALRKGRSVACTKIVAGRDAQASFSTGTITLPFYTYGGRTFYAVYLPYTKQWKRSGKAACAVCDAQCP